MPQGSKLGFTKSHYTMKTPHTVSNYDPNNNTIKSSNGGQQQSQGGQSSQSSGKSY